MPKLRAGTYSALWLLERACELRRAVATWQRMSTRRVEGMVQQLGTESMSKAQVPPWTSHDGKVEAFSTRPTMPDPRDVAVDE